MLNRFQWTGVLALFSALILACFAVSVAGGVAWAAWLLPLSGLFMSVIYPTINSKGISCLPKSEHGAGAGVILFFTCLSAVLAPLAMGAVSDTNGRPASMASFWPPDLPLVLFIGLALNWIFNPTLRVFRQVDETEYILPSTKGVTNEIPYLKDSRRSARSCAERFRAGARSRCRLRRAEATAGAGRESCRHEDGMDSRRIRASRPRRAGFHRQAAGVLPHRRDDR